MLTLPLELREMIYSDLLSSKRSSPLDLYHHHHSKGRKERFNLHPSILRTNKQIHAEAISYLYNANTFNLDVDRPISRGCHIDNPDHNGPILPLLRNDDTLRIAVLVDGEYDDRPRKVLVDKNQYRERYGDCRCHLPPLPGPGPIYPHVLRRLAHIELCIGAFSMWEDGYGRCLSETGKVVLEILRLLAEDDTEEDLVSRKSLKIKVRAKWVDNNLFLGDEGPWLSQEDGRALKAKMLALLREIRKRRAVEVRETVLDGSKGCQEIKEVDIEIGEAFLK